MSKIQHCIDWFAGAGAQLEVFSPEPDSAGGGNYRLRYIPPLRATIRPPLTLLQFGDQEIKNLLNDLDGLANLINGAAARGPDDPAKAKVIAGRDSNAEQTGQILFDSVVPRAVAGDLRAPRLFLDFGVDEALVQYPWELMHDGEEFLCLKHYLGRFVNSSTVIATQIQDPATAAAGTLVDKLSILVISVPKPETRPGAASSSFKYLPGAEKETIKIFETLSGVDGVEVKLLANQDATFSNVYNALRNGRYHIIHYVGHAFFHPQRHNLSSLVLKDRDMSTGNVCNFLGAHPPLLCFVNACDSGKTEGWNVNYNIFGLAQAFLATGSYLVGSRWNLEDEPAVCFAEEFYAHLVKNGKPIGQAIMEARLKTKQGWPESFAWASYVYYGDPRIYFRRHTSE
jgi:hypothetical protein